jgi:hypothetical protein
MMVALGAWEAQAKEAMRAGEQPRTHHLRHV